MLRSFLFACLCLTGVLLLQSRPAVALECNDQNPDYCTKCEDLEKAYKGKDVNSILVRGRSVWTPLYAAYFRDCPKIAVRYLELGANPAVGGMEGDMLATVISWDRWEVEKRSLWVKMLVLAGAKLDSPPITKRTSRERLMQEYGKRDDIMALIKFAEQNGG
jgi:hypothetical protein